MEELGKLKKKEGRKINNYLNEDIVEEIEKMRCKTWLFVIILLSLIGSVLAVSDAAVFQGQYFEGEDFQEGTYDFDFSVYDDETAGTSCFSDSKTLTTGFWGQWRTELIGISASCNDTTKDYFMEITIDNSTQSPRRRLTHFNYLRKNVDDSTTGDLTISSILNFLLGGYIQEFANSFLINKGIGVVGDINASGSIYSNNKLVCLEDGTNCVVSSDTLADLSCSNNQIPKYNISAATWQCAEDVDTTIPDTTIGNCSVDGSCGLITYDSELSYTIDTDTSAETECLTDEVLLGNGSCVSSSGFGGADTSAATECTGSELLLGNGSCMGFPPRYVSFISTVDGDLGKNDRYLPLGTDSGIASSSNEASWIIDRNLTITGILWNAASNDRTKTSAITLFKSITGKAGFSATSLSKDIQGVVSGSDLTFSESFSQGDLAVIKYESGGRGGDIIDLSITLIGTYN